MRRWTVLLAILTISFAACAPILDALTGGPRKEARSKLAPSAPVAPTLPSPDRPGVSPPPTLAPRVAPPPGHLSEESIAALSSGVVPQVPDRRGLFGSAPQTPSTSVRRGVLVCSVRLTGGGYDDSLFAGGADVYMRLAVAGGPTRATRQSATRIYTFPVARLDEGDSLTVSVFDDDVFRDDLIGRGSGAFTGGPVSITTRGAEVDCRVASARAVEGGRRSRLRRVDQVLGRLEGAEPDLSVHDFGYPSGAGETLNEALTDALIWMESSDPDYRARVERALEFEESWTSRVREAIGDAASELPGPEDPVRLTRVGRIESRTLSCGAEAAQLREDLAEAIEPSSGCLAQVDLVARPSGQLSGADALDVWGVDSMGSMLRSARVALRHGDEWVTDTSTPFSYAGGDRLRLVYVFPDGTRPVLLRVGRGRSATVIRLE